MIKPNSHPEYDRHVWDVFCRGKFFCYTQSLEAARWAEKEARKLMWRIRIERIVYAIFG